MTLLDTPLARLDGTPATLGDLTGGGLALVVNVASTCGLTPQYAGLEQLQNDFGSHGLTVVGVPCNQFGGQEPGTSAEIEQFCSATYGVSFPMAEKIEVNGEERHDVYRALVETPDETGRAGDITWNFEKFLIAGDGEVLARFSPGVEPSDPRVVAAITAHLG